MQTLEAIILRVTKFSDKNLIVKCLTPEGVVSFVKYGQKKNASLSILTHCNLEHKENKKSQLPVIKSIDLIGESFQNNNQINPEKNIGTFFLAEILNQLVFEKDITEVEFHSLKTGLKNYFQSHLNNAICLSIFLRRMAKIQGFWPYEDIDSEMISSVFLGNEKHSKAFKNNYNNHDFWNKNKRSITEDNEFLESILILYSKHIPSFKIPKSFTYFEMN